MLNTLEQIKQGCLSTYEQAGFSVCTDKLNLVKDLSILRTIRDVEKILI